MRPGHDRSSCAQHLLRTLVLAFACALNATAFAHGPIPIDPALFDQTAWPSIEEDIQSLSSFGARAQAAGERLVERGPVILPAAHAALRGAESSIPLKMQLITVLGEVGAAESVDALLEVAEVHKSDRYLYQNTLLALAKLPPDENATAFADRQLDRADNDPLIQRSALWYHAQRPTLTSTRWAVQYGAPEAGGDLRYAGLYLAAKLGDASARNAILELIRAGQKPARERVLLQGLAEIVPPGELEQILNNLSVSDMHRREALRLSTLKHGAAEERDAVAEQMLGTGTGEEQQTAARALLKNAKVEPLAESWTQGNPVVRSTLRREGFEIHQDAEGVHLEAISRNKKSPGIWVIGAALLLGGVLGFGVWWKMRVAEKR